MKKIISNISILINILLIIFTGCSDNSKSLNKVTFQVTVKNPSENQKVFITGNQPELGDWYPDRVMLDRINDSIFRKTISFKEGIDLEFKITAGNWWMEALDRNENIYNNFHLEVEKDTTILIRVLDWKNTFVDGKILLTENRFHPNRTSLGIDDFWKFHPRDNLEWAEENFDDSKWITTDSHIDFNSDAKSNLYVQREKELTPGWKNIGWFRFHMDVDSTLWNRTLALFISQFGASEIYYNGRLLYSVGEIGTSSSTFKPYQNRVWREIKIDPKYEQLIAVRYANYNWKEQANLGFDPGFIIFLRDLNTAFSTFSAGTRSSLIHQMVFTLVPLILFLLHILLYSFYRKQRANLSYSFCMLGFAGITYFAFERYVPTNPSQIILYCQLNNISAPVAIFFGLLTAYTIIYNKFPKRWLLFSAVLIPLIFLGIFDPLGKIGLSSAIYIFFGFTIIDIVLSAFISKNRISQKGSWIILCGFLILSVFIAYQVLIDYGISPSFNSNNQVFVYGMLSLAISMSIFLSYNFAYINKDIETQLANVKLLSEKSLEQERMANKFELERRMIEAENERKTKELEEARKLQLSILPKCFPDISHLEISADMRTAAEVGGDYYDYHLSSDGTITLTIGDATGHGIKAGIMVTLIKSLFDAMAHTYFIPDFFNHCTKTIKKMNLGNLYMGMTVLKIKEYKVIASAAGMPPFLIFRKSTNAVEEVVLKGMPLGAFFDFQYQQKILTISPGDVILLLTDGFVELFNANREMIDYDFIKKSFCEAAKKDSPHIIKELLDTADRWLNGYQQMDDITFLVIKIK